MNGEQFQKIRTAQGFNSAALQSPAEFDAALDTSIASIFQALIT